MAPRDEIPDIERILDDDLAIDGALAEGVKDALKQHKAAGNPVSIWEDGKVVWIQPEDIEV